MKKIRITRDGDNVTFETVNIDVTETVFFINKDNQPHKPSILNLVPPEQLGPGQVSSQVPVSAPAGQKPPFQVGYGCQSEGHGSETGTINVFAQLSAADPTDLQAIKGEATNQLVVIGGMPPYTITELVVNGNDVPGSSTGTDQTLPLGPGLELSQDDTGISVVGTPTEAETYDFTFTVDDSMGRNLQQIPYSMSVTE
jgi:hypothetical protein